MPRGLVLDGLCGCEVACRCDRPMFAVFCRRTLRLGGTILEWGVGEELLLHPVVTKVKLVSRSR
jgi:hypothetical protein